MKPRRLVTMLCAVGACLLLAVPMFAVGGPVQKDIVRVTIDPSVITVDPETELDNGRIRLINPEGLEIVRDFRSGQGQISIGELADEVEGLSLDGCWTYEVIGSAPLSKAELAALKEARESGRPAPLALQQKLASMNQSGSFMVKEGRFMYDPETGETDDDGKLRSEVQELDRGLGISADVPTGLDRQVISGDLTVYNSICVGFDCPTNPSFGADTIRLQENNLRIHFEDTSTAAGFPTTDWRIVANDQASGGASKFTIQDASANRNVFTVEANAPSNSLYVDDGGRVGMGTSTPVTEIHAVDGDTPTLRLAQDGSSGFAPQTWDIAGNETSFFVRDATNGSTLPFRIRPGAASNSLVIDTDGEVGVGVLSPAQDLHVTDRGDANTNTAIRMSTASHAWDFATIEGNGSFRISKEGTGLTELDLTATGNLTIPGSIFTGGGTCGGGCDLVFQPDFDLKSIEEHAAEMWSKSHLPAVGPTKENAPINLSEKTGGILHELEIAHIYIEQLHGTIQELKADLQTKNEDFVSLADRLAALEETLETERK